MPVSPHVRTRVCASLSYHTHTHTHTHTPVELEAVTKQTEPFSLELHTQVVVTTIFDPARPVCVRRDDALEHRPCANSVAQHAVVGHRGDAAPNLWRGCRAGVARVSRGCRAGVAQVWRGCGAGVARVWRRCGADVARVWRRWGAGVARVAAWPLPTAVRTPSPKPGPYLSKTRRYSYITATVLNAHQLPAPVLHGSSSTCSRS